MALYKNEWVSGGRNVQKLHQTFAKTLWNATNEMWTKNEVNNIDFFVFSKKSFVADNLLPLNAAIDYNSHFEGRFRGMLFFNIIKQIQSTFFVECNRRNMLIETEENVSNINTNLLCHSKYVLITIARLKEILF